MATALTSPPKKGPNKRPWYVADYVTVDKLEGMGDNDPAHQLAKHVGEICNRHAGAGYRLHTIHYDRYPNGDYHTGTAHMVFELVRFPDPGHEG